MQMILCKSQGNVKGINSLIYSSSRPLFGVVSMFKEEIFCTLFSGFFSLCVSLFVWLHRSYCTDQAAFSIFCAPSFQIVEMTSYDWHMQNHHVQTYTTL